MALRGAFNPTPEDDVPSLPGGAQILTVALFGFVGGEQWGAFESSAEFADGRPHPLDRWSRRLIDAMGARHGATGLYPSLGPPWLPFQRWAMRAEPVHVSPTGLLIHPDYGLWHAYRGALGFRARLQLPPPAPRASPCDECADKPCLASCPVGALRQGVYEHGRCRTHVSAKEGRDCREMSCRARRSCPVGESFRYGPAQSAFHMAAFLNPE
jgi:hypothetical protein